MEGEKQWTYFSGVISILRSVMRDDNINEYEAKAVCGTLNLYDVPGISIFVRGVKLYNKLLVRNLFARNRERINHILSDLRPKPKDDYERKEPGFTIPKRDRPLREPSDMEKASMELLRNDEVFYDELSENTNRFPLYQDIYNKNSINMTKKTIRLTESGLHRLISESVKKVIAQSAKSILKESSDTDAQWKSELKAFMDGLRRGNYDVSGDTVYVEIWKSRSASNDPRYVSYRRGDNRLRDDHFYMQNSPRLSRRTINAINKRLGWGYDDEYDL